MQESSRSPLTRLVLFMVCLAIMGTVIAGAHYLAIDLPAQKNVQAPANADTCASTCGMQKADCAESCPRDASLSTCLDACIDTYYKCTCRYCNLYC